jgi:tetratricopeptide (TPR) repeat protein
MSDPGQAVFISYASQDAAAAKRIAEALRAAGLEVWFDQNELRGGDAWDTKIRKQIKECALFVPLISANTQARLEGYYRLEWKLAVDRSHLMAEEKAFLLPIVIDDTLEAAAKVPDRFREVQWTRLRLEETPTQFAARVRSLLRGADEGVGRRTEDGGRKRPERVSGWWTRVMPLAGILFGLIFATRPMWRSKPGRETNPAPVAVAAPAPAAPPVPAVSEARKLMARAKTLYEPWEGATREDFTLAAQMLQRATELDPTDGEVWAAAALLACGQIALRHDPTPARVEAARIAAERATRLAPESKQARFAQAFYFRNQAATIKESDRILGELAEQPPDDALLLRTYAVVLRNQRKFDESLKVLDRAAALPGAEASSALSRYYVLSAAQRYAEAEAALDTALARYPASYLYREKARCLWLYHGDVAGATALIAKVPATDLLEDTGAYWAFQLWLMHRQPDKAWAVLSGVQRDLIECGEFRGPKAFLIGKAHQMAGRSDAARAEWAAALRVVEQQLATQPSAIHWVYWKARLLAVLDRKEEAEAGLKTFDQLRGAKVLTDDSIPIYLALGRKTEVLDALDKGYAATVARANALQLTAYRNNLKFNTEWDALRDEARFGKLVEGAAEPAK